MNKFSYALPDGYDWDVKQFAKQVKTNMNTQAQQIAKLPFWNAIRDADMLCIDSHSLGGDDMVWFFADGSKLYSQVSSNSLEAN